MSQRTKDVVLADKFTKVTHSHATATLDPRTNKLPPDLHVLIIGASQGIGEGIVYAYARAGAASIILAARPSSKDKVAAVAERAKVLSSDTTIHNFPVDITSSQSVAELARHVQQGIGRLDILVLNSGYSGPVVLKVDQGDPEDFQDVFNVNVQGTYLVAHHFIPVLRDSNGAKTFIVIGSFAAAIINGHIANTAYCISKFAQARLVEFIAEQYGEEDDILAVAVHPGAVNTEMADSTTPESFRPCKLFRSSSLNFQF